MVTSCDLVIASSFGDRRNRLPGQRRTTEERGRMAVLEGTEGTVEWRGHRTWYRVVGELHPGAHRAPVVIAHGGPGATHDYVEPIAALAGRSGRACVLYDQLGNGRSDHLPDAPADFWSPQLFKDE